MWDNKISFINFFRKKTGHETDATVQNIDPGINERLTEINERLRRIENKQKETSLQLEGIDDFLQGGGNEPALVDALITLSDTIGDFYYFAAADAESPLLEQARMMWNAAQTAAEAAGLEIIDADCAPFDFRRHSAESTEPDDSIPAGYVIKTLKCGYIYKNEVIRRAAVVVNKIDMKITPDIPESIN